jgi:hypothetical protein
VGVRESNPTMYDELLDHVLETSGPTLRECIRQGILKFTGERRLGLYATIKERYDGWRNVSTLAQEIALKKEYSILTGRGIFKKVESSVVFFPFFYHLAPILLAVEDYFRWLVSLSPKSIILRGKKAIAGTVDVEEEESLKTNKPTCGIALVKPTDGKKDCTNLQVIHSIGKLFSFCRGGRAVCPSERGRYCPFFKIGIPYGRLDLYTRKKNGLLLAIQNRQDIFDALTYIGFI